MALSGVRSSCDSVATKSSFSRAARSASERAARSLASSCARSSSARLCSEMSWQITTSRSSVPSSSRTAVTMTSHHCTVPEGSVRSAVNRPSPAVRALASADSASAWCAPPDRRPRLAPPLAVVGQLHQAQPRLVHHRDVAVEFEHRHAVAGVVEDAAIEALALAQTDGLEPRLGLGLHAGQGLVGQGDPPPLELPADDHAEQSQQDDDADRRGAVGGRRPARVAGLGGAGVEQGLFGGTHLGGARPDRVHHPLAKPLVHPGHRFGTVTGVEKAEDHRHLAEPLFGHR